MKKLISISIVFLMLSLLFIGCSGQKTEKERFSAATVEATCMVFQSKNIFDPILEAATKKIYKNYGFNADDDAYMKTLTKKYENDADIQKAITGALDQCAGDFVKGLKEAAPAATAPATK